jgi:hypothetical protein
MHKYDVNGSRYYLGIFLEGLTKTKKPLGLNIRCPGRDSNRAALDYKCRVLPSVPTFSEKGSLPPLSLTCKIRNNVPAVGEYICKAVRHLA